MESKKFYKFDIFNSETYACCLISNDNTNTELVNNFCGPVFYLYPFLKKKYEKNELMIKDKNEYKKFKNWNLENIEKNEEFDVEQARELFNFWITKLYSILWKDNLWVFQSSTSLFLNKDKWKQIPGDIDISVSIDFFNELITNQKIQKDKNILDFKIVDIFTWEEVDQKDKKFQKKLKKWRVKMDFWIKNEEWFAINIELFPEWNWSWMIQPKKTKKWEITSKLWNIDNHILNQEQLAKFYVINSIYEFYQDNIKFGYEKIKFIDRILKIQLLLNWDFEFEQLKNFFEETIKIYMKSNNKWYLSKALEIREWTKKEKKYFKKYLKLKRNITDLIESKYWEIKRLNQDSDIKIIKNFAWKYVYDKDKLLTLISYLKEDIYWENSTWEKKDKDNLENNVWKKEKSNKLYFESKLKQEYNNFKKECWINNKVILWKILSIFSLVYLSRNLIKFEKGDFNKINEYLKLLKNPNSTQEDHEKYWWSFQEKLFDKTKYIKNIPLNLLLEDVLNSAKFDKQKEEDKKLELNEKEKFELTEEIQNKILYFTKMFKTTLKYFYEYYNQINVEENVINKEKLNKKIEKLIEFYRKELKDIFGNDENLNLNWIAVNTLFRNIKSERVDFKNESRDFENENESKDSKNKNLINLLKNNYDNYFYILDRFFSVLWSDFLSHLKTKYYLNEIIFLEIKVIENNYLNFLFNKSIEEFKTKNKKSK